MQYYICKSDSSRGSDQGSRDRGGADGLCGAVLMALGVPSWFFGCCGGRARSDSGEERCLVLLCASRSDRAGLFGPQCSFVTAVLFADRRGGAGGAGGLCARGIGASRRAGRGSREPCGASCGCNSRANGILRGIHQHLSCLARCRGVVVVSVHGRPRRPPLRRVGHAAEASHFLCCGRGVLLTAPS